MQPSIVLQLLAVLAVHNFFADTFTIPLMVRRSTRLFSESAADSTTTTDECVSSSSDSPFKYGECKLVEVCTREKYCKRKGSPKTWALFQELAEGTGIEVRETDCFMECLTGPNVQLDGDFKRIHGNITTADEVKAVLGIRDE